MNPDTALDEARFALTQFNTLKDDPTNPNVISAAEDLADSFAALDEWITKGGFLPEAWAATVGALPAL